mgnify:FL=1
MTQTSPVKATSKSPLSMLGIKGSAKNVNDFAMSVKKAENLNVDIGLEDKYEDDDFKIYFDRAGLT